MDESQIANQFNSQSLADLLTSSINTVGGRVFPDQLAMAGLMQFVSVIESWRGTHAATYGNALPDTGTAYTANPSDLGSPTDIIAPTNNEVVFVNALDVENAGLSNLEFQILLGDTMVAKDSIAGGTKESYYAQVKGLMLSKGQTLKVMATGGTPSDLILNASGVKTCI